MLDQQAISDRLHQAEEADAAWIARHPDGVEAPAAAQAPEPSDDAPPAQPPAASPPSAGDDDDHDAELRNELADADRFVQDIIGKAWYCAQQASGKKGEIESGWLVWDGMRLRPSEDGAILRLARATALALSAEYVGYAKEAARELREAKAQAEPDREAVQAAQRQLARWLARADKVQSQQRLLTMVSLARIDERVLIDAADLDADSDLLNTPSGVLHLPTGELRPHDPQYRCTRITASPVRMEAADDAKLHQVLRRGLMVQREDGVWVPDQDRITYLQDVIGQALYGHQRLQQFYVCIGDGGDGKGTLFEGLLAALGGESGYAMMASSQSFVRQRSAGHRIRDDLANMHKARVVMAAELNKGDALDGALVKSMFGETTQRARQLYGKEFEFKPICTLFMQANHEPHVDAQDHAMWRRLVKVPFGPSLMDSERDPDIHDYLCDPETGGAALLAWALIGAQRTARARNIPKPPSVAAATDAYRDDQNYLGGFLIDELRFSDAGRAKLTYVAQAAIRPAIESWFAETRMEEKRSVPISGKLLGKLLKQAGAFPGTQRIRGKTTRVWFGMTLRPEHAQFDDACDGSFVPDQDLHRSQLAKSKGAQVVVVTSVTSNVGSPQARAENGDQNATRVAFLSPGSRVPADSMVSEVTRLQDSQEEMRTQSNKKESGLDIPDLDDLSF